MRALAGVVSLALDEDDPLPPASDVSRASATDLDQMYRAERPKLLRYLARRMAPDAAQDLVQQLFVRVVALSERHSAPIASPSAYLHEGVRNLIRDEAKAATRHSQNLHISIDDIAVLGPDPVAALEARDRLARLEHSVSKLKPLTREIFLAQRVDGYTYAEIASETGLSVKGVEKQMSKAIKQLRRHLHSDD